MKKFMKKTAVAVMTAAMLISSCGSTVMNAQATASGYVLQDKSVQELMSAFGTITFNKANIATHFHGNFLTHELTMNANSGLRTSYNTDEAFYFDSVEHLNSNISESINDIVYTAAETRQEGSRFYVKQSDGTEVAVDRPSTVVTNAQIEAAGTYTKYADLADLKTKFIAYNQGISEIATTDGNVTVDFSDNNNRQITVNSGSVNCINLSYSQLGVDTETYVSFPNYDNDDILIINVDLQGQTDVSTTLAILGTKEDNKNNCEENFGYKYNRVFYNFYDSSRSDKQYTGKLTFVKRGFGTVIAPSSNVVVQQNWDGTVISDNFTNQSEFHRINGTAFPVVTGGSGSTPGGETGTTPGGETGTTPGGETGTTPGGETGTTPGGEAGSTPGGETGTTPGGETGTTPGGETGTTPGGSGNTPDATQGGSSSTDPTTPNTSGGLVVVITDEVTDEPVPGATVEVTRPDGVTSDYTTDAAGSVVIENTIPGDYTVTVTNVPDGYNVTVGSQIQVTVEGGNTTERMMTRNTADARNADRALRHAADVKTGDTSNEEFVMGKTSITQYGAGNNKSISKSYNKKLKKFKKKHKKQSEEVAAWISISGTRISYPVMYTGLKNNTKYLHKNINGKEDSHGMIFASYLTPKKRISYNTIIYGHNMKDRSMFADLDKYARKSFYKGHKYVKIDTPSYNYVYEVVEVFRISCAKGSKDRMIYEKFGQLNKKKTYNKWKKQLAKNREYKCSGHYNSSDNLMILSTCEYSKENGRLAVLCKQVKCAKVK